jgi:exosortase A-associated hydrolase 1
MQAPAPYTEQPLLLPCAGEQLLAVLAEPAAPSQAHPQPHGTEPVGVVIVVGGPQYRAGSHRQFVRLARALAAAGHITLRFDARGMGDSSGQPPGFEQLGPDIEAAIAGLQQHRPQVRRVVLWGLCDGASAALIYLADNPDARVAGLCLVNPWVRSQQSQARTRVRHYYTQRLRDPAFWAKLLRGGVAWQALRGLFASLRQARQPGPAAAAVAPSFQTRMLRGWHQHAGPMLLLLSELDLTAKSSPNTPRPTPSGRPRCNAPACCSTFWAGQDHTFSSTAGQALVEVLTQRWLQGLTTPPTKAAAEAVAAHA